MFLSENGQKLVLWSELGKLKLFIIFIYPNSYQQLKLHKQIIDLKGTILLHSRSSDRYKRHRELCTLSQSAQDLVRKETIINEIRQGQGQD
jgi:hypothetical protein